MPVAPLLYLHRLLDLLHLIPDYGPIIFFIPNPFQVFHQDFTSFHLTKHNFPSHPLIHVLPSTSLPLMLRPITSLGITFGPFFNSVSTSSAFSLIAFETALFAYFLMLSYPLYSSVPFLHITLCASFFLDIASFPFSFYHHISPLLLLCLFFQYTLPHAFKTLSLKCAHKFGAQTSSNSITFS